MSGYCPDCGNTMCICSELKDAISIQDAFKVTIDLYKQLQEENERLKSQLKDARELIEFYSCDEIIDPDYAMAIELKAKEFLDKMESGE